ncbi:hypothetical protein D3C80_2199420 [compost metagenome]
MARIPPKIIRATSEAKIQAVVSTGTCSRWNDACAMELACNALKIKPQDSTISSENRTPIQRIPSPFSI